MLLLRVWKNGMVGGRERSSYAAPDDLLPSTTELRFSEDKVVATDMEDLLRLWRDVR